MPGVGLFTATAMTAATVAQRCGKSLDTLRHWGLTVQSRSSQNKTTCALAGELARICYATLRDQEPYEKVRLIHKAQRVSFSLPT